MKNVLLIGGAGYVGSVITSHFLKLGYNVRVLDKFVYKNQNAIQAYLGDDNYEFIYGDFSDRNTLESASKGINNVVILGGLVGDPITKKYPELSTTINDIGVKTCIDFFDDKKIEKLIFISTCSNYGLIKEDQLADEDFELNPLSLYAKAKVEAERHLMSKKGKVNYTGTVLRFATAFGLSPRMRFDLSLSEFVRDLYFGEELLVFDEHTWRPYCHVKDFASAIDRVFKAKKRIVDGNIFNVGRNENNFSKLSIIKLIIKKMKKGNYQIVKDSNDRRNYIVNFSKIKKILRFSPKLSISYGINEILSQFKKRNIKLNEVNKLGNYTVKKKFL